MKKHWLSLALLASLIALGLGSLNDSVRAQVVQLLITREAPRRLVKGYLADRYDLDSAGTLIYCTSVGAQGTIWDIDGIAGPAQVDNAGSSTSITDTGTGHPFTNVAVGDTLFINVAGTIYPRQVLARADEDGVTVDEAIDLSAADYDFTYRDQTCGTTSSSGWVYIGNRRNLLITFNMPNLSGDGNGVDIRLEGMDSTNDGYYNPSQLWPTDKTVGGAMTVWNFTTEGGPAGTKIDLPEPVEYIRLGMQHSVADDGTDTTTDAEQITVTIVGEE
jgi:hypothetical protein